ncbi:hypothetical protein ACFX11_013036 [Malus domestica]
MLFSKLQKQQFLKWNPEKKVQRSATVLNRKYYDRDVCRLYRHDLFQLTKMDMGLCPKVHSLQLRKEYEEAKVKGTDNYDRDLEDVIDRLIVECDRKIPRALKRLKDDDAKATIAISISEITQVIHHPIYYL